MKKLNKNFWIVAAAGVLFGGAFTMSAFTEPIASPANTNSFPPINLGSDTQIINNPVGFGDGSSAVNSSLLNSNSLFVPVNLNSDASNVRQNANLVQNVNVNGRNIVAGLVRVAQVSVSPAGGPAYDSASEKLFFPKGSTTNLITGNYCTTAANTACPIGTVVYKYDPATGKATCRNINPVKSGASTGNCTTVSSSVSASLTKTTVPINSCVASREYTATGSSSGYLWYLKSTTDTDWTYLGSGSTKSVDVSVSSISPSAKVYDLLVRDSASPSSNFNIVVSSLYDATKCPGSSQQGGGTGGGSNGQ